MSPLHYTLEFTFLLFEEELSVAGVASAPLVAVSSPHLDPNLPPEDKPPSSPAPIPPYLAPLPPALLLQGHAGAGCISTQSQAGQPEPAAAAAAGQRQRRRGPGQQQPAHIPCGKRAGLARGGLPLDWERLLPKEWCAGGAGLPPGPWHLSHPLRLRLCWLAGWQQLQPQEALSSFFSGSSS